MISDPIYGYKRVNVEAQRRDPHSLLNWIERKIRMRRECPEISWGDWRILDTGAPGVLVMRYDLRGHSLMVIHNFTGKPRRAPQRGGHGSAHPRRPAVDQRQPRRQSGRHDVQLEPVRVSLVSSRGIDRNSARGAESEGTDV